MRRKKWLLISSIHSRASAIRERRQKDGASGIFVASPHDRYAPYGPLLFAAALRGEFGGVKIAPLEGEI
jgi:hypothetical protein